MTAPAPAACPASRSLTVSPTTATAPGSSHAEAGHGARGSCRARAGPGRRRPARAPGRPPSTQPSASSRASRVDGAKPVVRQTWTPCGAQVAQDLAGAGHLADVAGRHDRLVGGGEGGGGPRRLFGSEQRGRTRPPWTSPSSRARRPAASSSRRLPGSIPTAPRAAGERRLDGAVVAHGRAGHIEAGQREGPDHAATLATPAARSVSARDGRRAGHAAPARPGHHPHARRDLLAQAHVAVDALRVDALPAALHGRERLHRGSARPARAARWSGPRTSAKSNGSP